MKKIINYALGATIIIGGWVAYKQKQQADKKQLCDTILNTAKKEINGHIIGTWMNMTATWSPEDNTFVYTGGITTHKHTFDFVANAKTGELLSIHQQNRLSAISIN